MCNSVSFPTFLFIIMLTQCTCYRLDPDHERKMLEEAEEAFRTYAAHQKEGSKSSGKTQNLIRSFTVDSSSRNGPSGTRGSSNVVSPRNPMQKAKSVDGYIASETSVGHVESVNETVSNSQAHDESKDACVRGLVKDRANIFSMNTPPVSGQKIETSHSQVKKWIASQPHAETEADENERYA